MDRYEKYAEYLARHVDALELRLALAQGSEAEDELRAEVGAFREMRQHFTDAHLHREQVRQWASHSTWSKIFDRLSKVVLLGPVALIKPAMFAARGPVVRLRHAYEALLGTRERTNEDK